MGISAPSEELPWTITEARVRNSIKVQASDKLEGECYIKRRDEMSLVKAMLQLGDGTLKNLWQ